MTATITREQVKSGLDAGTLTLIDALPESYYAQQHLPGALNLVAEEAVLVTSALSISGEHAEKQPWVSGSLSGAYPGVLVRSPITETRRPA